MNKINEINIMRVLMNIRFNEGISRADLARELGLVKSTVTKIVTLLLERNIVRVAAEGKSENAMGRKPLNLVINGDFGYILGLEIQTEFFAAAAVNLRGEVLFSRKEPLSMAGKDIDVVFFEVMDILKEQLEAIPLRLLGIGLGVAGIIDPNRGIIQQSNPLNITEPVHFNRRIKGRIGVPVQIENDAKCCSWGELAFNKAGKYENFLYVMGEFRRGEKQNADYWGIAIGMALVLNGKVYYGNSGSAGEFQSLSWRPGNNGQFSLTNEEARHIQEDRQLMLRALRELSAHAALFVNTLNLSAVIFGGEITEYKDDIKSILEEEIQKNWSYSNKVECAVEFSSMGDKVVAFGAAGMFLESICSIPDVVEKPGPKRATHARVLLRDPDPLV